MRERKHKHKRKYNSMLHKKYRYILDLLPENLDGHRILDCGMGEGYNAYLIRTVLKGSPYIEGFDIFEPFVDIQNKLGLYDYVYCDDIMNVVKRMKEKFDFILITAVIEHLHKEDSIFVLKKLKENTKKRLIVSTPFNEKLIKRQKLYQDNPYNEHISQWKEIDLNRLDFKTFTYDLRTVTTSIKILDNIRRFITLKGESGHGIIAWFDGEDLKYHDASTN
ncbi:MAG: class I SAM-dependent methyltransferase [Candidatus Hodarchaeota archaeon]